MNPEVRLRRGNFDELAFTGGLPEDQGGNGAVGRQVAGQDVVGPLAGPQRGAAEALGDRKSVV